MSTTTERSVQINQTFQPVFPLGSTATDQIETTIWANEFINFSQLLTDEENFRA